MSLIDPICCGFAKIIVFRLLTEETNVIRHENETYKRYKHRELLYQYDKYKMHFEEYEKFNVEFEGFKRRFPAIIDNIRYLGKKSAENKKRLLNLFSLENWNTLSKEEKEKHGLQDCDACIKDIKFKSGLKLFPWKSPKYKQKPKDYVIKR